MPSVRESWHINRRQANHFVHGIEFAQAYGPELNTLVTINFNHTDCTPERVSAQFERLRDNHFTRWLRYRTKGSVPPTYVWVIENTNGHTHVHWLVHLPVRLKAAFSTKLPTWVPSVAGAIHCEAAINVKPAQNVPGLRKYMLKTINPKLAHFYRVRPHPKGRVVGKRCGISKNLGPTAREQHRIARASRGIAIVPAA